MNIHPVFVHFPIALLTVYALLEVCGSVLNLILISLKKENSALVQFLSGQNIVSIKAFLVIVGSIATVPTLMSGETAEHIFRSEAGSPQAFATSAIGKLIETHSTCAWVSVIVFSIIALGYLCSLSWFSKYSLCRSISEVIRNPWVVSILACVGIILITVTGVLGGAITYGPTADPVVEYVYKLLI